jgi:hypothetical protein
MFDPAAAAAAAAPPPGTVWAMVGALVLAQLMCAGGAGSPAFIIAYYLTSWMGKGYLAISGGGGVACVCVGGGAWNSRGG